MHRPSACIKFVFALSLAWAASAAEAQVLLPNPANGNPHSVGPLNNFIVSLIPDPAVGLAQCPWLIPAAQAAAQPYNNATNIWKFNYMPNFSGTFTLAPYSYSSGTTTYNFNAYGATNDGSYGGADFNITYTPGSGPAPTGSNVRWMQVIDTNMPSGRGTTYGVMGTGTTGNGIPTGTTAYLDNAGPGNAQDGTGVPVDPYYGWLSTSNTTDITSSQFANSSHFFDSPSLPLVNGRIWEAQAFVTSESDTVSGGTTTHNVTIYGGVWWGFQDTAVPEPSAIALASAVGATGVLSYVWRRRRRRAG